MHIFEWISLSNQYLKVHLFGIGGFQAVGRIPDDFHVAPPSGAASETFLFTINNIYKSVPIKLLCSQRL